MVKTVLKLMTSFIQQCKLTYVSNDINQLFNYLIVAILGVVPIQPLFVEFDHNLGDFSVSFLGRNEISLIWAFPLDEKEQFTRVIGCPDNPLGSKSSGESPGFVLVLLSFLLLFRLRLLLWLGFPFSALKREICLVEVMAGWNKILMEAWFESI